MALLCVIDIKTKSREKYIIFEVTHTWFKLQILTFCVPMDCSLPGSSVRGIFQARVLEWVAIFFSRESSQPRDGTWLSLVAVRQRLYCLGYQGSPTIGEALLLFSCSVMFSLWPHGLQHARLPCPSPAPISFPLSWWCHPTISSSAVPFSCLLSFTVSGSFLMSQLFPLGG